VSARGILLDRRLSLVLRLIIGAVLVLASLGKLTDPSAFADALAAYALLPAVAVAPAAVVLPWIELTAGLALLAGIPARSAGLVAAVLAAGYVAATASALARGLDISCGCFGDIASSGRLGWGDVAWRMALLAATVQVVAAEGLVAQPAQLLRRRRP
jgi:putative oxidoreductase